MSNLSGLTVKQQDVLITLLCREQIRLGDRIISPDLNPLNSFDLITLKGLKANLIEINALLTWSKE